MKQQLSEAVKSMKLIEPVPYKKAKLDISSKIVKLIIFIDLNGSFILAGSGRNSPENTQPTDASDNDISLINNSTTANSLNETNGTKEENSESSSETGDIINTTTKTNAEEASLNEDETNESTSSGTSLTVDRKVTVISTCAPLPQTIKPNLPPMANFAVGMGELIYFENLPDSTGTYSGKLKDAILKCRKRFDKDTENDEEN